MVNAVLVDTGFWIAFYDPKDRDHKVATEIGVLLDDLHLVMPWPVLYETLRTRFVGHADWVASLDKRLKQPTVTFVDDQDYCVDAYTQTVDASTRQKRKISMVDMICRLLIEDDNIQINYLFTMNPKDFYDVCKANNVEILPEPSS